MDENTNIGVRKNATWTKEELNYLRVNYEKMTAREISRALGRPIQAVYCRAKVEKLHKLAPYNHYKKVVGVSKTETARVPIEKEVYTKGPIRVTTSRSKASLYGWLIKVSLVFSLTSLIISSVALLFAIIIH